MKAAAADVNASLSLKANISDVSRSIAEVHSNLE
jgi:hypothetical protein